MPTEFKKKFNLFNLLLRFKITFITFEKDYEMLCSNKRQKE